LVAGSQLKIVLMRLKQANAVITRGHTRSSLDKNLSSEMLRGVSSRSSITRRPRTVDEYISSAPKEAQDKLREVRAAISEVAPKGKELISYGMPCFDYKGRLAWFGLHKGHIGLYLRPPVAEEHKSDLAGYVTTKSAVHLDLDKRIPVALVKKLVRARMRKNEL